MATKIRVHCDRCGKKVKLGEYARIELSHPWAELNLKGGGRITGKVKFGELCRDCYIAFKQFMKRKETKE